jgi:hypothetical protein
MSIDSSDRREVVSGSISIETCAMSHCHDDSNEKFQRRLSFRVQESIREITKLISRSGLELFIGIFSWISTILVEKTFLSVRSLHIPDSSMGELIIHALQCFGPLCYD